MDLAALCQTGLHIKLCSLFYFHQGRESFSMDKFRPIGYNISCMNQNRMLETAVLWHRKAGGIL